MQKGREKGTIAATSVEDVYRAESRKVFATLVRLNGDFDLAEEMLHEAFMAAMEKWPKEGIPSNPGSWLVSTAKFKSIDILRRRAKFDETIGQHGEFLAPGETEIEDFDEDTFKDDLLRLIFTCCHPALSPNAQIALTLREICGLTTEEIASAFLVSPVTIAQRIVRAKAKIRDAKIPYQIPEKEELPERLDSVLACIYLVFNEGYSASSGHQAVRADLSSRAIHLGRVLYGLMPDPEVTGLLALMLLHESRRKARTNLKGDLILLEEQDRSLWDAEHIEEGNRLVEEAFSTGTVGVYAIQSAISATHSRAATPPETDWANIIYLYDLLLQAEPTPVIELNRAVAIAMHEGPERGLQIIEAILEKGELAEYHLAHAARADLNRRLGRTAEARQSYSRALELTMQEPERRFLQRRIDELS